MNTYKGTVQKGTKRGHDLGFPTINIPLADAELSGVYAGTVTVGEKSFPAALFADRNRKVLEAHLIDFNDDLYGKNVEMEVSKKIRDVKVFDDDEELIMQITRDIEEVKEFFKQ